jgi:hypothetical protein
MFTQTEVDALVEGRRPASITRRLRTVRKPAARRTGRPDSSKPSPPKLTRAELLALRKGRPTQPVRNRLFVESEEEASAPASYSDKPTPSQQPPTVRKKKLR